MFVRFRETRSRLQVSLVETRRVAGKVKQEHVATLGSVPIQPTTLDRLNFWAGVHGRFEKLSNRIDTEVWYRLMEQIHPRIPLPTPDEQRDWQQQVAEPDAKFYGMMSENAASNLADLKDHAEKTARQVSGREGDIKSSPTLPPAPMTALPRSPAAKTSRACFASR